jgi:N6-L-threonylcarbamoyladenine synthase
MIVLGIESTAHTFGVGIVDNDKVLANARDAYATEQGGIIPFKAQEHHVAVCDVVLKKALQEAGIYIKDVELISFSQGPGIGHTLQVGAMTARTLSLLHSIPLIGVNHCIAHLTIGEVLTGAKDGVLLYVSGANTQVIAYDGGKYRIFGETLDIGIGNFLDNFARLLGLGFPGGPKIAELARKGKNYIELPYTVKGMDVSFGGLLTNVKQKLASGKHSKEDLCYSVQETVFAMVVEVAERALAHTCKKELILGGGVACNERLQEMCRIMCEERGCKLFVPERQYLVDNAAMIAIQGWKEYTSGKTTPLEKAFIMPYERTDDVRVTWKAEA